MSGHTNDSDLLSAVKLALLSSQMREQMQGFELLESEPIAIVGMGCRFPGGADTPERFWSALRDGRDVIAEVPGERWEVSEFYDADPDAPGKMTSRWGAFLEDVDRFDPQFFGISPREAISLDPQQRLLLEVCWEALENGGIAPDSLAGSRTGVFIGASSDDFMLLQRRMADAGGIDAYFGTGGAKAFLAGRLAYTFGLEGPGIVIETACSSSLVAVHMACQSLRRRECSLAFAGGVNVILLPENSILVSKFGLLAPDGHCKAFDVRADGFARGEGCGVVMLKPLVEALADGNVVHAVIRGSAMNQGGRSNGLTAPNLMAERAVIRQALTNARVPASRVGFIEAHATGTSLGDAIEMEAIRSEYTQGRSADEGCAVGALKTNTGHLEAAAGIAGLIKTVLTLQNGAIAPNLHLETVNPVLDPAGSPFYFPGALEVWNNGAQPRLGAVSSFGISGANVHVILEEAPTLPRPSVVERPTHLLCLSAKSPHALRELSQRFAEHLSHASPEQLPGICYTANSGRARFEHRAAVTGSSATDIAAALSAFSQGDPAEGLCTGVSPTLPVKVAFLFSDEGSEYPGMGRELYETEPVFRDALDECARILGSELGRPLIPLLYGGPDSLLDATYAQPALFAVEHSLAQLWKSWGLTPAAVMGQGVGEYVAACLAGVFSLEDGLKLTARRAGPMPAFEVALNRVRFSPPLIRIVSSSTGTLATADMICRTSYWAEQARRPGWQFGDLAKSMQILQEIGCRAHVEIGPDDSRTMLASLGELFVRGVPVSPGEIYAGGARQLVPLPLYPFQRKRYWPFQASEAMARDEAVTRDPGVSLASLASSVTPSPATTATARVSADEFAGLVHRLRERPPAQGRQLLVSYLHFLAGTSPKQSSAGEWESFAHLGLDSLKLIALINSVRTTLAIEVPLSDFLGHANFEGVAAKLLSRVASTHVLRSGLPLGEAEGNTEILRF